jgi:hypothetical protein
MGLSSVIPPILPLITVAFLVAHDLTWYIFGREPSKALYIKAGAYGILFAFAYIRYRSVLDKLQIEVDGFLLKSGKRKPVVEASVSTSKEKSHVNAEIVPDSSWPPVETLGWTPFDSLPFNRVKPKGPPHFWSKTPSSGFQVRSVGYKRSKLKEPSGAPLYECVGVDVVKSSKLVTSLGQTAVFQRILNGESQGDIPWPWLRSKSKWSQSLGIPRLLIINTQLPFSAPSLWAPQSADSDPGFSVISYYVINPSLVDDLNAKKIPPPAVALLKRLIQEGQSKKETTALKVIGMVDNMEEIGFPDLVSSYNGKPVLVTKSAKLSFYPNQSDCELFEIEYDVRQWSILARKTLHSLRDKFKEARCQLGMVIEGQTDEELPEQLLGCFRLNYLDILEALSIEI